MNLTFKILKTPLILKLGQTDHNGLIKVVSDINKGKYAPQPRSGSANKSARNYTFLFLGNSIGDSDMQDRNILQTWRQILIQVQRTPISLAD